MGDFFFSLSPIHSWGEEVIFHLLWIQLKSPLFHSLVPFLILSSQLEATPTVNVGVNPFRVFLILQLQTQISVKDTGFYSFV